jgi:hypothetical protein
MSKVQYFLAGAPGIPATSAETAEIAVINALAIQQYEVNVMCGGSRASITGINLSADQSDNSLNDAGSTITGTGISASATDNSLNDSGNGFVNAGFKVGDVLTISGFSGAGDPGNNTTGEAVVDSVVAGKMVLTGVTLVSDDAGEAVTVSTGGRFLQRGFAKDMIVMVRGFTTTANNTSAGTIESVTATKMILSGAAGAAIVTEVAGDTVTICSVETGILAGDAVIAADYIAGTVPEQYKTDGTPIYTVFDPANPPESPGLASTQAIISTGEVVNVKNSAGTATDPATATVAAHVCTVALPANQTVLQTADTTTISSKGISLAVGSGVLGVATFTAATDAAISNGASTTVSTKPITLAVGTNTLGVATLTSTTDAAISSGVSTTVGGKAATVTVANNAVTTTVLTNATDAVISTADNLTLDGVTVPLVVSGHALQASTLIASGSTSKVITSGIEIPATGVITSKVTVTIVNGVITGCVGG